MRQIDASAQHKIVCVEENVVVSTGTIRSGRITNEGDFSLVNRLTGIDKAVVVVVVLARSILVVIVPLSEKNRGVRIATLGEVNVDGSIVVDVNDGGSIDINAVEGVCVILEVQGNEITRHACQVDTRNGQGFVLPQVTVSLGCGVTWVAKPVGVVVEDEVAASRLVVDSTLRVTIIAVDVSVGATLKGLLTDNCRCTAKNVGWRCGEHCCLDVEVNQGVTPVVCNDVNVEHAFCVETTRVEVINSFNRRVVEIERLDVTNDLVIDALLVPCMVAQCC